MEQAASVSGNHGAARWPSLIVHLSALANKRHVARTRPVMDNLRDIQRSDDMRHRPSANNKYARPASAIEPITMRIPDACRYVGVGRTTLYGLIAKDQIQIIKLGRSTLVLTESLRNLITERRGK